MREPSTVMQDARGENLLIRRFEVAVVDGPDRGARFLSDDDEVTIGTAAGTNLRLTDPSVSRHHCVVRASNRGLEVRDLDSTNGTFANDVEVSNGFIKGGTRIRLGATTCTVTVLDDTIAQPLAMQNRLGDLLGESPAMRRLFAAITNVARSDATVLVQGETGTGKDLVADAIHIASARRGGPFVIVDCSALPRELAEAELFGHVRGAFTGASTEREGALATADGGTVFLDEIGELPLDLQPLLLRALEQKTVRKVGATHYRTINVRVIAASHRDLRVEVNAKRFRPDLFYRLNVLRVRVPPLRDRERDIELLAQQFWQESRPGTTIPRDLLAELVTQAWPGNVRELRNAVERSALVGWTASEEPTDPSYGYAKEHAIQAWERAWIERLLVANDHNLSRAARAARMGRCYLRQLCQRYGLRSRPEPGIG